MKKTKKYILGISNNRIVTSDVTITDRNGYPEFTASFAEGEAFNVETIDDDYKKEYFENYWDSIDDSTKLKMLLDGDQTKEEAFEDFKNNYNYSDYHDFIDCSCTDYEITNNGTTINFDTTGCGQHDIREDEDFSNFRFTSEKLFNNIMYFWDHYHLKEIPEEVIEEVEKMFEDCEAFEEYSNESEAFIVNNIDWSVL